MSNRGVATNDFAQCKEMVSERDGPYASFHRHRCSRREWKGGYCKVHHPDNVKARDQERFDKFRAEAERRQQERERPRRFIRLLRQALTAALNDERTPGNMTDWVAMAEKALEETKEYGNETQG